MEPCTPSGPLSPIELPLRSCDCGAVLHAVPAGPEWTYLDEAGKAGVDNSPQALRDDPKAWWDQLATDDIGTYSRLSAAVNLGYYSFHHYHHASGPSVGGPYVVPECHEMPMQYVPDGWRCRVEGVVFPLAREQAA